MTTKEMSPEQKAIEDRFSQIKNIPINPEMKAAEQFGEMESWIFTLGEYRLMLNPMTQRWYFHDRVHNYWKDLDAPAGTIVFLLNGSELVMTIPGDSVTAPEPQRPATGEGRHFCSQCGAPLKPGLKFCSSCGTKIS